MKMAELIVAFFPTEQVTFFQLVTISPLNFSFCLNFWSRGLILFPPPVHGGPKGLLQCRHLLYRKLCSSEQPLMGRNLNTKSSYEGYNARPEYFENQMPQIGKKCICHATFVISLYNLYIYTLSLSLSLSLFGTPLLEN
jgi:hypothetical protein